MPADPLHPAFYARDPTEVARELLGKTLCRRTRDGFTSGIIVEVEAYLAEHDSASHSYRGQTRKNTTMFGGPGLLYVYSIHARYCLYVVTERPGVASAVLIRAVEPLAGVALMQRRRRRTKLVELTRGPARLCESLDVDRTLDGWDVTRGRRIWIERTNAWPAESFHVIQSRRIGVTSAHGALLRYFVKGNRFVSGARRDHHS